MSAVVAEGVDYANERLTGAALKAADKKFVVRYTSPDTSNNPRKLVTQAEIDSFRAAGIEICLVWETTQTRATQGFSAGVYDAKAAEAVRKARGLDVMPLYFVAQDQGDITGPQCVQYFKGVASVIGLKRVGAYGGRAVIKYLFDQKLIAYGWQTYAWSGGEWDPRAQLQQYHNGATVAGQTVDLCRAMNADFGQLRSITQEEDMPLTRDDVITILHTDGVLPNPAWRRDSPAHKPPGTNQFIVLQTLLEDMGTRADHAATAADTAVTDITTVKGQVAGLGSQLANLMMAVQTLAATITELKEEIASNPVSAPTPAMVTDAVTQLLPQVRLTVPPAGS